MGDLIVDISNKDIPHELAVSVDYKDASLFLSAWQLDAIHRRTWSVMTDPSGSSTVSISTLISLRSWYLLVVKIRERWWRAEWLLIETIHARHGCHRIGTFALYVRCVDERRGTWWRTQKILFLFVTGCRWGCGRSRKQLARFVRARMGPHVTLGTRHQSSQNAE